MHTTVTEGASFAHRVRQLAAERPDEPVYCHVAPDGAETELTWRELDDRSTRLAGALAARGLAQGDRLALGLRNSPPFTLGALAAWKLGAVPVPVRWDLPAWERARVRAVMIPPPTCRTRCRPR
jgi:bile acid-coenzyme A ligase